MMFLATTSNLQEIGNKVISIGMPILISLAVVIAIIMVAYYGIGGKFAKNAEQRKETIINLINKSRAFNYQCFLSFQTINDLKTNNINLTDTVFGNVNNIICHNIKDPNTAEYIASVFGTQETEKLTRQIDFKNSTANMGAVRSVDEFIVRPNDLKTLKIGECYFKTTLPSGKLFIKKIQILFIN